MLKPLTADGLRNVTHGFFTTEGGVSTGLYDSLNAGLGSSDAPDAVAENRNRVSAHLDAPLLTQYQIHSANVVTVTDAGTGPRDADAMVTATPCIALGVLTADCTPVLFADAEAGVVGAAHAGWKGAVGGVLEATVTAMQALGARPDRTVAALGPTISQRAYEVGPEFVERFVDEDPDWARFFAGGREDRAMFDLPGFCLARLRALGLTAEWTGHCTYADPRRFFSYRRSCHRDEPDYGRLVSAIRL